MYYMIYEDSISPQHFSYAELTPEQSADFGLAYDAYGERSCCIVSGERNAQLEVDRRNLLCWKCGSLDNFYKENPRIYAARDIETGKLASDLTNPKKKFWHRKSAAIEAINKSNSSPYRHRGKVELVTFELVEVPNESNN